ncbi:NlpC/P60 family protein [Corynebacterium caspium]|uniref:NlpC/P60 family protein n=1 Tax=Corynebacterium caspium TaxID=234828 RepID=UPI00037A822F|nr:NlpC/P60 family protein [Corynebacterium caspium]WKD58973.1 putative endopeptidase precursor [Corynebacterium caspium DSM 44850]
MGKHSRESGRRNSRALAFGVASGIFALNCSVLVPALATDLDELIHQLEESSRAATSLNEEVKALEENIANKQHDVDLAREQAHHAADEATLALQAQAGYRVEINRIASSKYRGALKHPGVAHLGAKNPQIALDRKSYLELLARDTERTASNLSLATQIATEKHNIASRAAAAAEFERNELNLRLDKLRKESEDLKQRADSLMAQIDALDTAQRQAWIDKNGPANPELAKMLQEHATSGVVQAALSKIGSPYSWGAVGPDAFDCSGLMVWAYNQQGKSIPRTSQAQLSGGMPVNKAELQPGDIVAFFPGATHVGMYIGEGKIVHASDYGIPVQVVSVDSMPFAGAARY